MMRGRRLRKEDDENVVLPISIYTQNGWGLLATLRYNFIILVSHSRNMVYIMLPV